MRNDRNPGGSQDEKAQEKEREKRNEKGQGLDEKYRRDPAGFLGFTLLIIWLGVFLLLQNLNVVTEEGSGWAIFAWGAGAIVLGEAAIRLVVPHWRRSLVGSFVWGAILVGVGFGLWYNKWEIVGPLVIIAIGVAILAGRLLPRR